MLGPVARACAHPTRAAVAVQRPLPPAAARGGPRAAACSPASAATSCSAAHSPPAPPTSSRCGCARGRATPRASPTPPLPGSLRRSVEARRAPLELPWLTPLGRQAVVAAAADARARTPHRVLSRMRWMRTQRYLRSRDGQPRPAGARRRHGRRAPARRPARVGGGRARGRPGGLLGPHRRHAPPVRRAPARRRARPPRQGVLRRGVLLDARPRVRRRAGTAAGCRTS